MATGALDANGIWQYGEDDSEPTFSVLLNKLASSTSSTVTRLESFTGYTGTLPIANGGTGATTVAGARTALGLGGTVLQVVSVVKSDTHANNTGTWQDVTGLSASITPSSSSSKVLVSVHLALSNAVVNYISLGRILRASTVIAAGTPVGSRSAASFYANPRGNADNMFAPASLLFLDSPATTAATTYKIQTWGEASNAAVVNRNGNDPDYIGAARLASTITLMEIAN